MTVEVAVSETSRMEIRALTPEDAAAYWKVRLTALESETSAFGMAPEEFRSSTVEEIAQRLRDLPEESFYLGAFDGGELVGIATFIRGTRVKERHKGNVYGVYMATSHRGQGTGGAMMRALVERAKTQPTLEQIMLAVATCQEAANRLYRSFGFELYGTEPRALKNNGEYIDEHLMVLRVR